MTTQVELALPMEEIIAFCKRNRITYLGLFGSAARGEMRPDSDMDLLVEWDPAVQPGLLTYIGWQHELTRIIGREVDLVMRKGLKPLIRDTVLASAVALYER